MTGPQKYLILGGLGTILAVMIVIAFVSGKKDMSSVVCKKIEVEVQDSSINSFTRSGDIVALLEKEYGTITGIKIDSLDLNKIENIVENKSAIEESNAYTTADGVLHISLSERVPAVRFQLGSFGYYADKNGFIFPLQKRHASYVPVIDGAIPLNVSAGFKGKPGTEKEQKWLQGVLDLVEYIAGERKWRNFFIQMHVDGEGQLQLIPFKGKERFIIGHPDDLEEKFGRIEKYYNNVKPNKEEDYYTWINVKFNGQIICKK